jgi:hypothetical protein
MISLTGQRLGADDMRKARDGSQISCIHDDIGKGIIPCSWQRWECEITPLAIVICIHPGCAMVIFPRFVQKEPGAIKSWDN